MIKITKRKELPAKTANLYRFIAVILALIASSAFIIAASHNPLEVYPAIIKGSLGSMYRIKETIIKTIPLVITSLGISIAFRMKFWNIGAEGQIMMGAFFASFVAYYMKGLPMPLMILFMLIAGFIGGGLLGLIPAFFKAKYNTNETLFTLMLNYIVYQFLVYLQFGPWKDPEAKGFPKMPKFVDSAVLPKLFGIHIGWIFMLILVALVYWFVHQTKKGYEINVIGESVNTARYAGMDVKKIIFFAMFLSGGICGLTGMVQVSAITKGLTYEITGGVGFTAIITAWLAKLNPIAIVLVCFLFAALVEGGSFIQIAYQIPQATAMILQGMILFFLLGCEFFIDYQVKFYKKEKLVKEEDLI